MHLLCAYARVIASSECKHDGQWYLFCRCTLYFFSIQFFSSLHKSSFSFFPSTCTRSERVLVGRKKKKSESEKKYYGELDESLCVTSAERGKRVTTLEYILENPC